MTTHNKKSAHKPAAAGVSHKPSVTHTGSPAAAQAGTTLSIPINTRTILIFGLVIAAFFGAYRFAQANNSSGAAGAVSASAATGGTLGALAPGAAAPGAAAAGGGGGCCGGGGGGGGGGAQTQGTAALAGRVQKISVDVSTGVYNPNVINLKAGVPAEITFSQASGCTSAVQSQQLNFQEDLSAGPKTVKLAGLSAGTYSFSCGMGMVTGQIVVK